MAGLSGLSNHSCERRRGLLVIGVCLVVLAQGLPLFPPRLRGTEGGVLLQQAPSRGKDPHPTLPEDGEGKEGCGHTRLPCVTRKEPRSLAVAIGPHCVYVKTSLKVREGNCIRRGFSSPPGEVKAAAKWNCPRKFSLREVPNAHDLRFPRPRCRRHGRRPGHRPGDCG